MKVKEERRKKNLEKQQHHKHTNTKRYTWLKKNMNIYQWYSSIIVYGVNITVNSVRSFAVLGNDTKCKNAVLASFAIFDFFDVIIS